MMINRTETVTLPQTKEGLYMAKQYQNDMKNAGMTVRTYGITSALTVEGHFCGELADEIVRKMKDGGDD